MVKAIIYSFILACLNLTFIGESYSLDLRSNEETNNQVKQTTDVKNKPILRIMTGGSPGSGVIIGKKKNIYSLLTAKHVIEGSSIDEIEILKSDGTFLKINEIIIPFKDKDLAIIRFYSDENPNTAIIPPLDKELWKRVEDWSAINVSGFANPNNSVEQATFRETEGQLISVLSEGKDGYDLLHSSPTNVGMSGGGVFAKWDLENLGYAGVGEKNREKSWDILAVNGKSGITYEFHDLEDKAILEIQKSQQRNWGNETNDKIFIINSNIIDELYKEYEDRNPNFPRRWRLSSHVVSGIYANREFLELYESEINKRTTEYITEDGNPYFSEIQKNLYKSCVDRRKNSNLLNYLSTLKSYYEDPYTHEDYYTGDNDSRIYLIRNPIFLDWIKWRDCSYKAMNSPIIQGKYCSNKSFNQLFLLLGIHGRSENYAYGGKSGVGLGIFLGDTQITNWLNENSTNLGIKTDDAFAEKFCNIANN